MEASLCLLGRPYDNALAEDIILSSSNNIPLFDGNVWKISYGRKKSLKGYRNKSTYFMSVDKCGLSSKNYFSLLLSSGEEFVPVFTGKLKEQDIKLFKLNRIHVIKIGSVQKGQGVIFTELKNFKNNTFNHFKNTYLNL